MYRGDVQQYDGEAGEEVIYSRDPKIVNYSWTKEATRLLIGIRAQLDAEFDDPNQRKMDLWEKISLALKERGFDFPPSICDKKWRNLLVSFRRTVSRGTQGKQGRFPYTWEFYEDLLAYWQKKDPIGIRRLMLAAQSMADGEGFHEDKDLGDSEFDAFPDDNFDEEDFDDNVDSGDLNKFLSVTLTESDDETGQGQDDCIIGRRGEIEIRPHPHNQVSKVESLEISTVPYSPTMKQTDSPPLPSRKFPIEIKPVTNNRSNKFRPTPTITIEEVRPPKRRVLHEDEDDLETHHPNNSIHGLALGNSQLNISLRDRIENNQEKYNSGAPVSKHQRREREESPPPSWLTLLRTMEESAQRRWEVTEARQIREYKQKRELDLQLLQTMQNLSSVLVKMTEEAT